MKTFKSFLQLDELTGVAPKAKGEHKFVHSTYLAQIKDPGDLEKVGPEEIGPHDTKMAAGKRPADRLDNKQKFGESVDLEENYRTLAQKGIGAERKEDIKVGHGVDYYHPKTGDKHMGKIHSMSDKGYTVKDDKTGEKHSFDYFRKEEVELGEGLEKVVLNFMKKHGIDADFRSGKLIVDKEDMQKAKAALAKSDGDGFSAKAIKIVAEPEDEELDEAVKSKLMMGSKVSHPVHGKGTVVRHSLGGGTTGTVVKFADGSKKTVNHKQLRIEETELEEASYTGKGNHRPGWMLRADPELAKKFKEKEDTAKKRQAAYGNPAAGKSVKEESELHEEVPMAARALYAQTYAKHGKTASKSSEAKQKAYDAVEKKHGAKVLAQLKAHHEKNMNEESELEEADFSKSQTTMAHAIGKHFKKKGIGDESKGGPYAVASAMVRDKPEAAKKAYATIKAKMKNEDHQDMLMALYDELSEENQQAFEAMLDSAPERLLSFAQSHFTGE